MNMIRENSKKKQLRVPALLLALLLGISCFFAERAEAASGPDHITVNCSLDTALTLYRVGHNDSRDGDFVLEAPYAASGISVAYDHTDPADDTWLRSAKALADWIAVNQDADGVKAVETSAVKKNGTYTFSGIDENGLYLLVGTKIRGNGRNRWPQPMFIRVLNDSPEVTVKPAGEKKPAKYRIVKKWIGDDSESRPQEVHVNLYNRNDLQWGPEMITLKASENWAFEWTDETYPDVSDPDWVVTEERVSDYTVDISEAVNGDTKYINLTNTWRDYTADGFINLKAKKIFENGNLNDRAFEFQVLDEDGTTVSWASTARPIGEVMAGAVAAGINDAAGEEIAPEETVTERSFSFRPIHYQESDMKDAQEEASGVRYRDFTYTVRETVPADAANTEGVRYADADPAQRAKGSFVLDGIEYAAEHQLTVRVTDDSSGRLAAKVISLDGQTVEDGAGKLTFTNRKLYTELEITKDLEDFVQHEYAEGDQTKAQTVSFAFRITGQYEDRTKPAFEAYAGLNFDGTGRNSVVLDHIPADLSEVTVEEIYSFNYAADEKSPKAVKDEDGIWRVSFRNTWNDEENNTDYGSGIVNRYSRDGESYTYQSNPAAPETGK